MLLDRWLKTEEAAEEILHTGRERPIRSLVKAISWRVTGHNRHHHFVVVVYRQYQHCHFHWVNGSADQNVPVLRPRTRSGIGFIWGAKHFSLVYLWACQTKPTLPQPTPPRKKPVPNWRGKAPKSPAPRLRTSR